MKNILFLMLLLFTSFVFAVDILLETPAAPGTTGWTNNEQTNAGVYGYVHGMWGSELPYVERTFATSGQTSITISFRYWAVDSWDNETGYLNFNGSQLWAKAVSTYNAPSGWDTYSGTFPNPWGGYKRYADVSVTTAFTGTSFTLRFGATINEAENNESWGFSNLSISNNVVPEPATLFIFCIALSLLALGKYKK
ncbi:MAG: PEP-CTERM sorting domain-containing protein [Candidatus Brocadiae bacterium]|nr:PEP-CTERM sorting domain-containing protein [Candidatus Brocadiia bacterium]